MTQLAFFDISNNNGSGIIVRALTGLGFIAKCTEGLSFVDGTYQGFMARGRSAGQCLGAYHFAHWANDPVKEAAFFAAHNDRRGGEFEFLDWEMYGSQANCPASRHGPWVAAFLRARPRAGLYTNADMMAKIIASASAADLALIRSRVFWKATVGGATPGNAYGFQRGVSLWQWRDTQGIDEDWSFLTAAQWRSLADNPGSTQPPGDDVGNVDTISDAAADKIVDRMFDRQVPYIDPSTGDTSTTRSQTLKSTITWWERVVDGTGAATTAAVIAALGENTDEARRMLGVLLGWNQPKDGSPEADGLAALRATAQLNALTAAVAALSNDPDLTADQISALFDAAIARAATKGLTADVTLSVTQDASPQDAAPDALEDTPEALAHRGRGPQTDD